MTMPEAVNPWNGPFTIEAWIRPPATPTWRDAILINKTYQVDEFRLGFDEVAAPRSWSCGM